MLGVEDAANGTKSELVKSPSVKTMQVGPGKKIRGVVSRDSDSVKAHSLEETKLNFA